MNVHSTAARPETLRPYRWQVRPAAPPELKRSQAHLHPVLLQVLYNRGLQIPADMQAFLDRRYLAEDDPFLLADMDRAVERIGQAITNDERIIVYGDFDADGVTATVLLVEALRGMGLRRDQVQPYIPDRVDEGYGLNDDALEELRRWKEADLVITVDCGIRSIGEVSRAQSAGLDMIVTDHHSIGRKLPPAVAVINPKRPDSPYPEKMLAGVGIAFKLAQALRQAFPQRARFDEEQLLDLVALGTVADLAPLTGENRRLVSAGLEVLNRSERPGVLALATISGLTPGQMTAEDIGFRLGPRINAAGRLAHAYDAARLLAANNLLMAQRQARRLDELNRQRQQLTRRLSKEAEAMVADDAPIIIAADPGFISGVVGLVASRLADKHYRPAVVIEQGEQESRGSCRSIPEFHITEALDEIGDLLERYGGHAAAAGFTVRNENLDALQRMLTEIAADRLGDLELIPALTIDAELALREIDWALHGQLAQLEPTGIENAMPIFVSRNVEVLNHRAVGQDQAHMQLTISDGTAGLKCIAFRQGDWAGMLPAKIDVAYTIGVNEWNGRHDLQLVVKDIQSAEAA